MKHRSKYAVNQSRPIPLRKKPFIVDTSAAMLRRNPELSRNSRILYGTMRALADGKTGHLKIPGRKWGQSEDRWLKAAAFDRAAEMCRCVRLKAMRELVAYGLVTIERERIERFLGGRRRVVLGPCHYTVHRQAVFPKTAKKPKILQESIFSTVEEIDSQYLSKPPGGSAGLVSPALRAGNSDCVGGTQSSSAPANPNENDDDSPAHQSNGKGACAPEGNPQPNPAVDGGAKSKPDSYESRLARFKIAALKNIQARSTETPETIDAILDTIIERATDSKSLIHSAAYLEASFDSFLAGDCSWCENYERERGKSAAALTAEFYKNLRFTHGVVKEAARQGRPAREILAERLTSTDTRRSKAD